MRPPVVIGARDANKEAKGRYLGALAQRERASNILNPNEVSGEYDAGRLLSTTLGGQIRALTHEDLKKFRESVKVLGKQYKGGITAKSVVDLSLPADRDRANKQINVAIPMQSIEGRIHFITNAGPDSQVTRHHVHLELLNYSLAISSPAKAADMVRLLTGGALKFDCDCERHRYVYRYVATVGRYNAGVSEVGYPKIMNPRLVGVACKHVLRVMQQLSAPMIRAKIEKMIENGRNTVAPKLKVLSKKEAKEIADEQAKQTDWKRNKVESGVEKQRRFAQQRAIQTVVQRSNMAVKSMTPAKIAVAKKQFETNARKLAAMGVLTPKQLQTMLGKLKA